MRDTDVGDCMYDNSPYLWGEMNMRDTDVGDCMYDNSPYLWGEMNAVNNNHMDTDENKPWHMYDDEYYEMENLIGGSYYPNMENDTSDNITDGEYNIQLFNV
jgi:hypothetical protein